MSLLLRPVLVFLAVALVVVLIAIALFGGFSGDDDDGADGGADKKAEKTATVEPKPPPGTISAQDLKLGHCITDARSTSGDVRTFIAVDCAKPHDGEVYTLIKLEGAKYPGTKFVTGKGKRGCRARFKRQATAKALRDRYRAPYRFVYPTAASWRQDYRSITCLATYSRPRTGKLEQR